MRPLILHVLDTTTPQGEMIFTVMASLAQFERTLISARVKGGMARAKAQGTRSSHAPMAQQVQDRIAALHAQSISMQQICKQLRMAYETAWNSVQRLRVTAGVTQEPPWAIRRGDGHGRALSVTSM
jgi:DNA invertase Pin-like site-specific DNA recombinase